MDFSFVMPLCHSLIDNLNPSRLRTHRVLIIQLKHLTSFSFIAEFYLFKLQFLQVQLKMVSNNNYGNKLIFLQHFKTLYKYFFTLFVLIHQTFFLALFYRFLHGVCLKGIHCFKSSHNFKIFFFFLDCDSNEFGF